MAFYAFIGMSGHVSIPPSPPGSTTLASPALAPGHPSFSTLLCCLGKNEKKFSFLFGATGYLCHLVVCHVALTTASSPGDTSPFLRRVRVALVVVAFGFVGHVMTKILFRWPLFIFVVV